MAMFSRKMRGRHLYLQDWRGEGSQKKIYKAKKKEQTNKHEDCTPIKECGYLRNRRRKRIKRTTTTTTTTTKSSPAMTPPLPDVNTMHFPPSESIWKTRKKKRQTHQSAKTPRRERSQKMEKKIGSRGPQNTPKLKGCKTSTQRQDPHQRKN